MNRKKLLYAMMTVVLVSCTGLILVGDLCAQVVVTGTGNPNQVAILRWYNINQSSSVCTAQLGPAYALAFDGTNIWVSTLLNPFNQVGTFKYRASDGAPLGGCGGGAGGLAYDGTNMWAGDGNMLGSSGITKVRASDCAVVGRVELGPPGAGNAGESVAFDGANIWASGADPGSGNGLFKIRASDATLGGSFHIFPADSPHAIAFDGTYIWVATGTAILKLDPTTGLVILTLGVPGSELAFDGANMWVLGPTLKAVRVSSNTVIRTVNVTGHGLAFDGSNVWVAGTANVVKVRAADGLILATYPYDGVVSGGIAFDGANMWVGSTDLSLTLCHQDEPYTLMRKF